MILSSITTEPLDDGEADLPVADKEPKAARRGLLRVNYEAKFKRALSELERMEHRRAQLIAFGRAEGQAAEALLNEYLSQTASYPVANGDVEAFKKAYKECLAKNLELSPRIEALRKWIGGLSRQQTLARSDDPGSIGVLKVEFPTMKQTLVDAVCAKAGQLREEADRIAKDEQKRLDDVYGVGEYEAEETQVVKRARSNAEYLDTLVERAKTEPVETLYLDVVRYLLR